MDIVVSLTMLITLAPIMLVVAAIIRLSLGGPVIFAQPRIGYGGKRFTCYKFRSMATNADEVLSRLLASDPAAAKEWHETRKLLNDPRVGCLGNVLRKSSIDELPQLFNVLLGNMSLVGPRPVVPDELANYGRYARTYSETRPGITGLWQTSGRNRLSYRARIARDSYYARHWSLWLDVVLLLKTIPAIMNFDSTA
jgi:exopolysaccharide production protein ExoY